MQHQPIVLDCSQGTCGDIPSIKPPHSFLPLPPLPPTSAPTDPMPCCCQQLGCPVWRKCGIVDGAGDNEISNNGIWIFTAPISSCDPSRINRTLLVNFYNLTDATHSCKRAGNVLDNSSQLQWLLFYARDWFARLPTLGRRNAVPGGHSGVAQPFSFTQSQQCHHIGLPSCFLS